MRPVWPVQRFVSSSIDGEERLTVKAEILPEESPAARRRGELGPGEKGREKARAVSGEGETRGWAVSFFGGEEEGIS